MYVNYYDRVEKMADENPTVGILLCTSKNDTAVKMALPEDNKTYWPVNINCICLRKHNLSTR